MLAALLRGPRRGARPARRKLTARRRAQTERARQALRRHALAVRQEHIAESLRSYEANAAAREAAKARPTPRQRFLALPGIRSVHAYALFVQKSLAPLEYPPGYKIPRWYTKKYTVKDFFRALRDGSRMYIRSFSDPYVIQHGILDPAELERVKRAEEEKAAKQLKELKENLTVDHKRASQSVTLTRKILEALRDGMSSFVQGYKEGRVEAMADLEEEKKQAKEGKGKPRSMFSIFDSNGTEEEKEPEPRFTLNKYRKMRQERIRVAQEIKEKAEEEAQEAEWAAAEAELEAEAAAEVARREKEAADLLNQPLVYEPGVGKHKQRRAEKRRRRANAVLEADAPSRETSREAGADTGAPLPGSSPQPDEAGTDAGASSSRASPRPPKAGSDGASLPGSSSGGSSPPP